MQSSLVLLFLSLCVLPTFQQQGCDPSAARLDCGYYGIQARECESKGCCWSPVKSGDLLANGIPWCFYPVEKSGYSVKELKKTDFGYSGLLDLKYSSSSHLGKDYDQLKIIADFETKNRLHVKIGDVGGDRYEVPEKLVPRPKPPTNPVPSEDLDYDISITPNFGFQVVRKSNNEILFDTSGHRFVFKDQFIEITSSIPPDAALYGLGESTRSNGLRLTRNGHISTLWNRDQAAASTNVNLYGSHPILYDIREGGLAHGVFLLSSNGMDIILNKETITYRLIGGVLDFYFFLGPTPEDVLKQYQAVIGKPVMPPFWSLGFHQCRYGYKNVEEVESVVERYKEKGIPLETMWGDIDYMNGYRDFSLEELKYSLPKMRSFIQKLHSRGQKWVPIVDPGIKVDRGYPAYDNGIEADVFLKDAKGKLYTGDVWPGQLHFVDYWHPGAGKYWTEQFREFYDKLAKFDGIWIDMNEPANFCGAPGVFESNFGGCLPLEITEHLERPPYAINNGGGTEPLSSKTIPMSIRHYDGTTMYDAHNLFGLAESIATYNAVQSITKKRPFILSRSTFPGSGSYVAHWSGDNAADWSNLRYSIVSILNSNLFGIPFAGADICGFIGTTNEELCARWISVGAFYPFARDHSDHSPQELYLWPRVADAAKKALKLRYQLLPYLYTAFARVHYNGGAVAMPLWMKFNEDKATHDIDTQFMLGDSLLISPVMEQGRSKVSAYFPAGTWYSIWDKAHISGPTRQYLSAPLGHIPIHVLGGSIVPMQAYRETTAAVMLAPMTLLVAFTGDKVQTSEGYHFADSGDDPVTDVDFLASKFEARVENGRGVITVKTQRSTNVLIEEVVLLGMTCGGKIDKALIGGQPVIVDQSSTGNVRMSGFKKSITTGDIVSWSCTAEFGGRQRPAAL